MDTRSVPTLDEPAAYRLCLQGRVSASWQDWLKDVSINQTEDNQTVITGIVRDQAALFGLLSYVRDLGVPLISVEFHQEKEKPMNTYGKILPIILKAVAVGMGIAVIVLNALGSLKANNAYFFLGLGVTTLALAALQKE